MDQFRRLAELATSETFRRLSGMDLNSCLGELSHEYIKVHASQA